MPQTMHPSPSHTTHRFDDELENLCSQVLRMGGLVEEQLLQAITALMNTDLALATATIANDDALNDMQLSIDGLCTSIIATRSPLGSDLRSVITVIRTTNDLERMGDEAARVALMVQQIAKHSTEEQVLDMHCVSHLASLVRAMLHDGLNAFSRTDVGLAIATHGKDKDIDREYQSLTRELIDTMVADTRTVPIAILMLWVARALERIGDRVCNICEYVFFKAHGENLKHWQRRHGADDPA